MFINANYSFASFFENLFFRKKMALNLIEINGKGITRTANLRLSYQSRYL
jgi:hypothetical protein